MPRPIAMRRTRRAHRFVADLGDFIESYYGNRLKLQRYARDGFFLRVPGYYLSFRADNRCQIVLGMNGHLLTRHIDYADELKDTLLDFLDAEVGGEKEAAA